MKDLLAWFDEPTNDLGPDADTNSDADTEADTGTGSNSDTGGNDSNIIYTDIDDVVMTLNYAQYLLDLNGDNTTDWVSFFGISNRRKYTLWLGQSRDQRSVHRGHDQRLCIRECCRI